MADRQKMLGLLGGFRGRPIQWNHAKCCGPTFVAMATTFALGAESNRLPACMYVSLSVTLLLQIDSSFLFLDGIEPFFARQFSMWHSTKLFSSIFDLGPLTPKIYSPKFKIAHRPDMFGPTRGDDQGGRSLLSWQRHLR